MPVQEPVIIGHSERRADHGESDKAVRASGGRAQAGLTAIMCVGESLKQRKAGETLKNCARTCAVHCRQIARPKIRLLPMSRSGLSARA